MSPDCLCVNNDPNHRVTVLSSSPVFRVCVFVLINIQDWSVRFNPDEPVAPRDDVNSPDLYIPSMAIVTYVLVCGFLLGTRNDFTPEKLGLQASSALDNSG